MTHRSALVIINPGRWSEPFAAGLTDPNQRICAANAPTGDAAACLDAITNVLAEPASPDRVVLAGCGEAGLAAMEFADAHPERVVAVVVVDAPSECLHRELSCPALVLPDTNTGTGNAGIGNAGTTAAVHAFLADLENTSDLERASGLDHAAGAGARSGTRAGNRTLPPVLTATLLNDPEIIQQLRQTGPVHRINAAGAATSWLLTGYEATTATLADPALVGPMEITAGFRLQAADPAMPHRGEQDLVTIDGQEHARLRRLVGRYLTPGRVEALRPRLRRETDALLDTLDTGEAIDLLKTFARPLPIIVLCELLGVPPGDRGYIAEWLLERMTAFPPSAHSDIDDYLRALIADRRVRPTDDLLGWVVAAEGDRLSETDLIAAARLLMVGGHRAPTTLLANGVALLLRERQQWKRLVAEPALVATAVEELLRLVTPFPVGLIRHVNTSINVGGTRVPAGDLLAASLVAANRDPELFTDPDALDIAREPNPHLAFGHGHHYCLGAALARAQAQIAIGALAQRFPDMDLADDPRSLHYRQSRVRYLLTLPVILQPRS